MTDKNGKNITITRKYNPSTGNIDFFTVADSGFDTDLSAALNAQQVNLSRGRTRMYSLTNLSAHNGTGACWKDGQDIHTAAQQAAYEKRVDADIATACAAAAKAYTKAVESKRFNTAPVTVASFSV